MNKLKLLFIDFSLPFLLRDVDYPVGGWAVELNSWIKGLCVNGHQVGVLTRRGANEYVGHSFDFDLIETFDPDQGIKILKYFYSYIPALYKNTKNFTPDVIIQACAMVTTGIMATISEMLKVPFVYRVANDMDTDKRYKKRLPKYAQISYRYGLKKADLILCQNEYQYKQIKNDFPEKPACLIPNPFAGEIWDSDSISSFEARDYIAWLGIFSGQKNLTLLYDIARKLPEIPFKVAGKFGNNVGQNTHNIVEKLYSCSNVEFVGYLSREQVPIFLGQAKALLSTSYYEGFSNTFLEAFSTGTPVIVPKNVDPSKIIYRYGLGYSIHTADLSEKIIELFKNEKQYATMSKRCIEYVKKNHSPKVLSKELIEIIINTLKQ